MTYAQLVAALAVYVQQEQPSDAYTAALPTIVSNAELRIYRDLDLAATSTSNASLVFTPGSRVLDLANITSIDLNGLPVAYVYPVTVEGITAIVPAWQAPTYGGRVRFQPVSWGFLDMVWPNESVCSVPGQPFAYFAMLDDQTILVAPTPDQQYTVEVIGTWRPAPMSNLQQTSWVGDHMPDLLFDACMVEATGFQRDFGAQADDPRQAISWENRYQATLTKCREEELKRAIGRPPPINFPMTPAPAPAGAR